MNQFHGLWRKFEALRLQVIRTELRIGLTFATSALRAEDNVHERDRNEHLARQAYDAARHFAAGATFSAAERAELESATRRLESALARIGVQRSQR